MELRRRLDDVAERAMMFQLLKDVANDPETYENAVEIFIESIDCFTKFLTDKEYLSVFNPVLDSQCPIKSIIGFSRGITTVSSMENQMTFRDVMIVLGWLKYVVEKHLEEIISGSLKANQADPDNVQLYRDFARCCASLPDKIANCHAKALTEENIHYIDSVGQEFTATLLQGIQKALILSHDKPSSHSNLKTISELISAGRNIQITSKYSLLSKLMKWIYNLEEFDEKWIQIMNFIFMEPTCLGTQVHEALITLVFLSAKSDRMLMRCISTTSLSGTLRRVVMVKLPFQRYLKPRNTKILINFIHRTHEIYGIELFETALKIWSDVNFAKRAPEAQERNIVRILVYSIHLFQKSQIKWNELFSMSMNGVHSRMGKLPVYIESALFINSTLSRIAMEEEGVEPKPMKEGDSDFPTSSWTDELKWILEHGLDKRAPRKEEPEAVDSDDSDSRFIENGDRDHMQRKGEASDDDWPGVIGQKKKVKKPPTPRESEDSDDEKPKPGPAPPPLKTGVLDSDDDEDFPTYQIDESELKFQNLQIGEEPKTKIPSPSYIQDAYEMLLEKEKFEIFEAALFSLKKLIDRRAIGFNQIAEQLFIRLINLQNAFGTKDFDKTVDSICIACITQRPEIVPALIRLILSPGQSYPVQQRLLHYIHKAADELGVLDKRTESIVTRQEAYLGDLSQVQNYMYIQEPIPEELRPMLTIPEMPEGRREAEARIAGNTRRIGTTRTRPQTGVVNRLAKAAKYMFYPLLVVPRGENARLLGEESDLLAYIIMVASMIYVRCGRNIEISKMSIELINYVSPHRFSENAKLRTSVIAAYMNVIALLPAHLLADLFPLETREEWLQWTMGIVNSTEAEVLEHSMALQISTHLQSHLQTYNPIGFMNF